MKATGKIISYTSGSIPSNLVSLAFATYVQFYYIDYLGGNPTWIGVAATIQAIYATLLYPFLGYLSDRTTSRWGRRIPFIVYGSIPLGITFILVWLAPFSPSHVILFTAYFFVTSILYDTVFNLTIVNWSALFPELFKSSDRRAYASAWKQMFGIIGLIAGLALPPMVASTIGWPLMGTIFGCLSIATLLTTFPSMELKRRKQEHMHAETPEPADIALPIKKALQYTLVNRSFITFVGMRFFVQFGFTMLTADLSFYVKYNLHLSGTQQSVLLLGTLAVALPLVYVWSLLVPRIGAFTATVSAVILFALALIPFVFATTFNGAMFSALLLGIGLSGILMLTDVLISDVIDEDELQTGRRREGMFYSIHGLIVGLGNPLQAGVTSLVLVVTGYTHHSPEPTTALWGFRMMITVIPFAAILIGLGFFIRYPLRKHRVKDIQQQLNESETLST